MIEIRSSSACGFAFGSRTICFSKEIETMFRTRFMRFVSPALLLPLLASGCTFKDAANAAQGGILAAINGVFNTTLTNVILSQM